MNEVIEQIKTLKTFSGLAKFLKGLSEDLVSTVAILEVRRLVYRDVYQVTLGSLEENVLMDINLSDSYSHLNCIHRTKPSDVIGNERWKYKLHREARPDLKRTGQGKLTDFLEDCL